MNYNDDGTIKQITVKAGDTLPVGTEVDFDGTTIPAGWEEVTPNMKVLWTNSDTTQTFSGQQIVLNDSISNYNYYEVIYKINNTRDKYSSSGKIPTNCLAEIMMPYFRNYERLITALSGTSMTISSCIYYATYGNGTESYNNDYMIPYQVIGYK